MGADQAGAAGTNELLWQVTSQFHLLPTGSAS